MDVVVCVKHVPETAEEDLKINLSLLDIDRQDLAFDINEWDHYAVEEAILLKEKYGGTVTVITIGPDPSAETLRKCLGMGADEAIHVKDEAVAGSDGFCIARILKNCIASLPFDLILTGVQAEDDGWGVVGVALAELLGIPHAAVVNHLEMDSGKARIHRELEDGLDEALDIRLPAVLTIQTGINEPRYVSIMGIRKAKQKKIKELALTDLNMSVEEAGASGSFSLRERIYLPEVGEGAQILQGGPEATSEALVGILREKGAIG